jgi:predicted AAA+ superfamily ATPase
LFLQRLVAILADNIGSLVSANGIAKCLKAQSVKTSVKVVLEYLNHLHEACFVRMTPMYDIHGKRLFEVGEKCYFTDLGVRNAVTGYRPDDISKLLENMVCQHLCAHGYSVTVGVLNDLKIDFVADKTGRIEYCQVAYLLPDEQVVAREFGTLERIPDQYPKYVISLDPMAQGDRNRIRHVHLRDFLNGSKY